MTVDELARALAQAALAVTLGICTITDLRARRIPNLVTGPALLVVLAAAARVGGRAGLFDALGGLLLCAAPLLLASARGAVGAGDVKLIAVCGAAAGWPDAANVLLYVTLAGGVQAGAALLWARLRDQPAPRSVPYGCAIAAGTACAWLGSGGLG